MLSIGVIGAGHLGKIHLKLLKELPSYHLKGFYDNDASTRQQVSETLGIATYADADSLIAACDGYCNSNAFTFQICNDSFKCR